MSQRRWLRVNGGYMIMPVTQACQYDGRACTLADVPDGQECTLIPTMNSVAGCQSKVDARAMPLDFSPLQDPEMRVPLPGFVASGVGGGGGGTRE